MEDPLKLVSRIFSFGLTKESSAVRSNDLTEHCSLEVSSKTLYSLSFLLQSISPSEKQEFIVNIVLLMDKLERLLFLDIGQNHGLSLERKSSTDL